MNHQTLIAHSEQIPSKEIKGFKTVLPKGRNPAAVSEMGNITGITNAYDIREIKIGGVSTYHTLDLSD